MRKMIVLFLILALLPVPGWSAEEKVKVDEPSDPIGDILFFPFRALGEAFSGETVVYDPDEAPYALYDDPYYRWNYWEDPWYHDRYYRYRRGPYFNFYYDPWYRDYYRHHRHHRHHRHKKDK